jgi:hypothetical protein
MKTRRPHGVKFLTALVLIPAIWNSVRLAGAIRFWDTLSAYQGAGGPLYLAVSGAAWAGAGFVLAVALWQGKPWAWGGALGFFLSLEAWFWFDRLAFQQPHNNNLFVLAMNGVCLALLLIVLFSRGVMNFYHEQ